MRPAGGSRSASELQGYLDATNQAIGRKDWHAAFTNLGRAIRLQPNDSGLHIGMGRIFVSAGRLSEAERAFSEAVRLQPQNLEALLAVGKLKVTLENHAQAEPFLRRALQLDPNHLEGTLLLARVLANDGRFEESLATVRLATKNNPNAPSALIALGSRLHEMGRFEEARDSFARAIELDPAQGFAYWGMIQGRRLTAADAAHVERMKSVLGQASLEEGSRMSLLFALGKAHDDLKDYEAAMHYYDAANQISDRSIMGSRGYPRERYEQMFNLIQKLFTREKIESLRDRHESSPIPIFIVGMPRSGTTLVEQIISAHPMVAAGGEIKFWLDECAAALNVDRQSFDFDRAFAMRSKYEKLLTDLASGARFVTDKVPGNYRALGLLQTLFPQSKIIHCSRHPVDTCLSIYMTPFTAPPDYSSDQNKLVETYRLYESFMRHWNSVLTPDELMTVVYEDLVANPEPAARRMLEFCGLEWDPTCLRPELNERPVATASFWQAKQPIYSTSTARWKNYLPYLGSLRTLVG